MKQNIFIKRLRKRWIVLGCIVLAIGAGFVYILKATPVYTCSSRVFVEQGGPPFPDEAEGVLNQSKNFLYTQTALMTSTPIISSALERPGISNMKSLSDVDNKIAYLKENVKVSVGMKDDIISISLDSPYPAEGAQLVNSLVDSYVTYLSMAKKTSSSEVLAILHKERIRHNKELGSKRKAMVKFKTEHEALVFGNGDSNIILARLADLSRAVTDAQLKTIEAKVDYETIQIMASDPVKLRAFIQSEGAKGVILSSENESLRLHRELDLLRREFADLSSQVGADHPSVKEKEAKMKQIEMQLADLDKILAEAQLAIAMQQYHSAQQREKEIIEVFEEQRQMALTLNEQLTQYAILESDWQQSKKACELLDNRIKELNVTEDVGALNITILEIATPTDKPSAPQKGRILAMALVLGMMSGCGLSLLKKLMDHS